MVLAIFCSCAGRFGSDLVGNPKDRFCRVVAPNENTRVNLVPEPSHEKTINYVSDYA